MKLASKELLYNWKKYFLVEIIIILMMFMVLFLSGLVNGLGRAVSSGIDNIDAKTFVLSDDAEQLITVSKLTADQLDTVKSEAGSETATINIQRLYIEKNDESEKLSVTYFAIEPDEFINPDAYLGEALDSRSNVVVLDDDFEASGISVGDYVKDSASGIMLEVVGFTKDAMYGHISVAYISTETYEGIMESINPMYQINTNAVAVKGEYSGELPEGTEGYAKSEIIDSLPSYKAEQMTITMVEWLLVVITSVIIGIFFYVINLQKEKEFGVMKAIGTSMGKLSGFLLYQVFFIAVCGAVIAACLVALMSGFLPGTMPFYLEKDKMAVVLCAFVLISVFGSLATINRVAMVDPAQIIGGDYQ